jgi:hypothetical protein
MKIYLTLDYELFFGQSGTAEKCMIEPTEHIVQLCEGHGARCVLFVDAGYIDKLNAYSKQYPRLKWERQQVASQLKNLSDSGHDVQLHVHPHWEGTVYDGKKWVFDMARYRLDCFSDEDVSDIFTRYVGAITSITRKPITAFRAGGWCIQPFAKCRAALEQHGIRIDSTVFVGGKNSTVSAWYDFSHAPDLDHWRFEDDPCVLDQNGKFTEYPIANYRVPPTFFWRLAFTKIIRSNSHRTFGDGTSAANAASQLIRLLTSFSQSVVSIDGYKSSFLMKAYKKMKRQGRNHFVVIGHPKALTKYSLLQLEHFLENLEANDEVTTFSNVD